MGFFGFFSLFDNEQNCKRLSNYSISRPQCMSSQNSIFFLPAGVCVRVRLLLQYKLSWYSLGYIIMMNYRLSKVATYEIMRTVRRLGFIWVWLVIPFFLWAKLLWLQECCPSSAVMFKNSRSAGLESIIFELWCVVGSVRSRAKSSYCCQLKRKFKKLNNTSFRKSHQTASISLNRNFARYDIVSPKRYCSTHQSFFQSN